MPRCANGPVGVGGPCVKHRFVETLPNGVSHAILKIGPGIFGDDTQVFTVPPDSYPGLFNMQAIHAGGHGISD